MAKSLTPSQLATAARIDNKQNLNQVQRLALVGLQNNKENRKVAEDDVADVVRKTLAGHYQQKPELACAFIRSATGLEQAIFDPLFGGFNGHRDQLPGLFAALSDPFAAVLTARAEQAAKLIGAGLTRDAAEAFLGKTTRLDKARAAPSANKTLQRCAAFAAKYGTT